MTWERRIANGSPAADHAELENARAYARSQGLDLQVSALPGGGFHVRAVPAGYAAHGAGPQSYGQPQGFGQPPSYGQVPAYAQSGFGQGGFGPTPQGGSGGFDQGASGSALAPERITYLRKVYSLLGAAALVAVACGWLATHIGVTEVQMQGGTVELSLMTLLVMSYPAIGFVLFGLLFASTFVAARFQDNPKASTVILFAISGLLGLEAAPFIEIAALSGASGAALSSSPVRDAAVLVLSVFAGLTAYVAFTKKDFSYLAASLNIGFWLVFAGALLGAVFGSEPFNLAIASVGSLVMAGMLLVHTSRIFRDSEMDNPAADALGMVIMLRNLFLMLLRILSSRRN